MGINIAREIFGKCIYYITTTVRKKKLVGKADYGPEMFLQEIYLSIYIHAVFS